MEAALSWLTGPGILGLPKWGVLFFVVGALVEALLGRSKDPRFRSLAQSVAVVFMLVLKPIFGRIPGFGRVAPILFSFLVPDTANKCKACDGSGIVVEVEKSIGAP